VVQGEGPVSGTSGQGGVFLSYKTAATPITLNLTGTTKDSSGQPHILIGQHCSASLNGIPAGCTVSNYQWSVSGNTFQTWSADTPAVGSNPYNPDASYYVGGPGPLTNPTARWYWNDLAANTNGPAHETVSCTLTITPPAGQGAAFAVTATRKVTVYWPLWTAFGVGGTMVVSNGYPNNGDYWLYAGPTPGSGETGGMDWYAIVSPPDPNPAAFGAGSLQIVQLVIPGMIFTSTDGDKYNWSTNGQEGLDTSYPYGWVTTSPTYFSRDSPGIDLSHPLPGTLAYSGGLQDQFEDYLLYFAPGSAQCVPLGRFVWSTAGSATIPFQNGNLDWAFWPGTSAGTVTPSGTPSRNFVPNNSFPMWTQNTAIANGLWARQ